MGLLSIVALFRKSHQNAPELSFAGQDLILIKHVNQTKHVVIKEIYTRKEFL